MTRPTANSKHGTRYEIAVGGKPRLYRDVKAVAIESAQHLKSRNPNMEVAVRDLENGETVVIKNPQVAEVPEADARRLDLRCSGQARPNTEIEDT